MYLLCQILNIMNLLLRNERALIKIQTKLRRKQRWVKIIAKYRIERDNNYITYKELIQIGKKTYN